MLDLSLNASALVKAAVAAVGLPDQKAQEDARVRLDSLTKPKGSLGRLESLSVQLSGITGQVQPQVTPACIVLMAGDHGVTAEGVSPYPSVVTQEMVRNFLAGGAAVNVLSRAAGAKVRVVDMGMAAPVDDPALEVRAPRRGTASMAQGPAMSRQDAEEALAAGIRIAQEEAASGTRLLGLGEMGIGNTTPSSAILSAFTGLPATETVGRGTGLDEEGWRRKVAVVEKALSVNRPDPADGLDVLQKVGGLEIAGLAGVVLGAAAARIPVLLDGFITGASALIAAAIQPRVLNYCIASHLSVEPGHAHMLNKLGLSALLQFDLRLGEGSGAALAFPLIESATKIMCEMATFDGAGISGPSK